MGVAIRDIVADFKTPVTWDSLPGVAAIDANNAFYQFLTIIRQPDGTPLMDRRGRVTSHLSGILFRVSNFLEKGIKPVFVFDGKPAALKQTTIDGRRKIRDEAGERWKEAIERGMRLKPINRHGRHRGSTPPSSRPPGSSSVLWDSRQSRHRVKVNLRQHIW